ncbi:hypothetical protein EYB53_018260 [Candidatus Chloroploca sp. M-50]|uniref:Uncharacterized protein n=1 Tax=Candidatus Chloroploca mongolica TaxID=2528176 RepID=A0ABS4DDY9_9CHLR|nr:hypothetical protein [Candidatus Chloroploca mongolica]MBP1467664.1 hypothetical protein [Candidatus Chloroploca mongolica]
MTRLDLARELLRRMYTTYGDQIVLGGSLAIPGEDDPWSGLKLWFVVEDSLVFRERHLLFQEVTVAMLVTERRHLEAELGGPGLQWATMMGRLDQLQPLVGDADLVAQWRTLGMRLDHEAFLIGVATHLPALVFQAYGRLRAAAARNDELDATLGARCMIDELCQALCLINRRWVIVEGYPAIEQSMAFPVQPEGYAHLVNALLTAQQLSDLVPSAGALMSAYWRLLVTQNMHIQRYQKIEQI